MTDIDPEPKGNPTAKKGDFPHVFTKEEARRGAARSLEVRREKAKGFNERVRDFMEKHEQELFEARLKDAMEDWRAHAMLMDRSYGTPAKSEPERIELDVGSSEARGVSLSEIIGVSQARDNAALNGETAQEPHS